MLYGIPELEIVSDDTDMVGLRTLVCALDWEVPRWPMTLPELDDVAPGVPEVSGGLLLVGRRTRHPANSGVMNTAWVFTGIGGSGKDVTFRDRTNSLDYNFSPGFAQVDIGLHPRIQQLLDDYQGYAVDGEIFFPPTIPKGKTTIKNPMGLVKDFLRTEGTYSLRYVSKTLGSVHLNEGKIIAGGSLPGQAPTISADRNWLVAPTLWQRRGPVFEIVEQYWLSGPGGWPVPIYGKVGDGAGSGRGLPLAGDASPGLPLSGPDGQVNFSGSPDGPSTALSR